MSGFKTFELFNEVHSKATKGKLIAIHTTGWDGESSGEESAMISVGERGSSLEWGKTRWGLVNGLPRVQPFPKRLKI